MQPSLAASPICNALQLALLPAGLPATQCPVAVQSAMKSDCALTLCLQVPSTLPSQPPACSTW